MGIRDEVFVTLYQVGVLERLEAHPMSKPNNKGAIDINEPPESNEAVAIRRLKIAHIVAMLLFVLSMIPFVAGYCSGVIDFRCEPWLSLIPVPVASLGCMIYFSLIISGRLGLGNM